MSNGGKIDIQSLLSNLPFSTTGIPYEKHLKLPGMNPHNFTGPGTNLQLRLNPDDTPKDFSIPINRVDEIAMKHDLAYRDAGDNLEKKHEADRIMLKLLDSIEDPTVRERIERLIVKAALKTKLFLGVGLTHREQLAEELHKQFMKPHYLLNVQVRYKDEIWSADLIEMPKENVGRSGKYRYILTVIDLYTRYAWAIPMKTKSASEVKEAFKKIFEESNRKPIQLWVDKDKAFYNSQVQPLFQRIYSTQNEGKAVVIERFNRTLKSMLFKQFTIQGHQKWFKILPDMIEKYNHKIHSSIQESPYNASKNPTLIEDINLENFLYNENHIPKQKPKFKVNQRVRIFKYKKTFEKGYIGFWTNEIFKVKEIINSKPITYKLVDLNDEEIIGTFYQNELQATTF